MAIRVSVSGETIALPVATNEAFRIYWEPGCKALDLIYIPRFYDWNLTVTALELGDVMEELERLKDWMQSQESQLNYRGVIGRIERLEGELPGLVEKHTTVTIG